MSLGVFAQDFLQADPLDYMEDEKGSGSVWRNNTDKVIAVLRDHAHGGQVTRMSEQEARTTGTSSMAERLACDRRNPRALKYWLGAENVLP